MTLVNDFDVDGDSDDELVAVFKYNGHCGAHVVVSMDAERNSSVLRAVGAEATSARWERVPMGLSEQGYAAVRAEIARLGYPGV